MRKILYLLVIGLMVVFFGCDSFGQGKNSATLSRSTALSILKEVAARPNYIDPTIDTFTVMGYGGPTINMPEDYALRSAETKESMFFLTRLMPDLVKLTKDESYEDVRLTKTTKYHRYQFTATPHPDIVRSGQNLIQWRIFKPTPIEVTGIRQEGNSALVNYTILRVPTDAYNHIWQAVMATNKQYADLPPALRTFLANSNLNQSRSQGVASFTKYDDGWRYSGNAKW